MIQLKQNNKYNQHKKLIENIITIQNGCFLNMTANLLNSYSSNQIISNHNLRSQKSNRYENLHKNFVTPQQNYLGQSGYITNNPKREVNFQDLRVMLDKPKSTIQKHKFQGQSVYTDTYKYNEGYNGRSKNYKQQDNLVLGDQPFYGTSQYTDNHKGNTGTKNQRVPVVQNQIFPKGVFDGNSVYHDHYVPNESRRDPQIRPQGQLRVGQGKFQGNSSYVNDYQRIGQVSKQQKFIHKDNEIMPKGNFEGNSTYQNAYIPGKIEMSGKIMPENELKVGGRFEGSSSYVNDFNYKPSPKVEKYKQPQNNAFPKGRFQGQSNYQGTYVGYQGEKSKQIRPKEQWKVQGKFQGNSSYLNDFKGHMNGMRSEKVSIPNNQIMPQGRFQGNTNYQANYLPNQAVRQKQYRPQGQLRVGQGQFQGHSSYVNDFRGNGRVTQQQKFKPKQNQILPQGRFQGNSAYQQNYIQTKGQRGQSVRPRPELEIGGKFEGVSSYTGDFNEKRGIKAERTPLPVNQVFPDGRFDGESQYTNSYVPSSIQKVEKVTMKPELKVGEGKFQGISTYAQNHQGYYIRYNNQKSNQMENYYNPQN